MEKQIELDGKKYQLVYKGLTNRIYRDSFGEDCLTKLQEMRWAINVALEAIAKEATEADEDTKALMVTRAIDNQFLERLVWASIKASKKNKKVPDATTFVDNIEQYNVLIDEGVAWLLEILKSMQPTVEVEETETEEQDTKKLA